ncbi:MAG: hypothetical protein GC200_04540 [Tepidisphaera sp.]|nr:hypothetical protein [Tepidisphaera sp.]
MTDSISATILRPAAASIACLLLCAGSALAQDSVSRNANGGNGLPGDGLSPYTSTTQRASYVVDLSPFTTAWGTPLGIAPVLKSSRIATTRFSTVTGPSTISQAIAAQAAYPSASYTSWNQAGGGLNATENNTALNTSVSPSGQASLFGIAMLDVDETTAGTTVVLGNFIHGAQVAFDPANPTRLFVTRTVAAVNQLNATQPDRSQFGLGSIDAEGNLCFRADGYNAASGTTVLQGDNYFRVRLPQRLTSGANIIDNNGAGNPSASDWLLQRSTAVTHAVPTAIPQTLAGRSVLLGPDFTGQLKIETSGGTLTNTTSNRPNTIDQRGPISFSAAQFGASSVGTIGVLSRSGSGGGKVDSISLAGVSASGNVVAARTITLPSSLIDTCDGTSWNLAGGGFRGYDSQITFRGGVGPAAIGKDASGNLLAAGVLYSGPTPDGSNPFNAIVVGRFNPASPNSPVSWTVAAWVDSTASTGKAIRGDYGLDGAPNTHDAGEGDGVIDASDAPIGRLASLSETTLGLSGPSLSSPTFDAAGNIYFIGSGLFKRFNGTSVVQEFGLGLFRGVYDPAQMCYTLDLITRVGDTFAGQNSGRNYQIQSIALADGDSVSSASLSSSSSLQQAWNNIDASALAPAAPQNLGGLVVDARIVYDTNSDGLYQDPTLPGGNVNSPDEAYNVVLYIANTTPPQVGPTCDPDVNQDGVADQGDVDYLINVIAGGANPTNIDPDFNQDGVADQGDIDALVNVIAGGPCP